MDENALSADTLYRMMKEEIMLRKVKGGQKLRERELAERFGVSITPVREALTRLEYEGLIVRNGKTRVVRTLSCAELQHYYSVRLLLEPEAVCLAATNATDEDIEELSNMVKDMKVYARSGDLQSLDKVNRMFDELIYTMGGNPVLKKFLMEILVVVFPYRVMATRMETRLKETVREHEAIFKAIAGRKPAEARRAARRHIKNASEVVMLVMREFEEKGL